MTRRQSFLSFTILIGCLILAILVMMSRLPEEDAGNTNTNAAAVQPLDNPTVDFANPNVGPKDAPVTVVVFSDYLCPACATMNDLLNRLVTEYPTAVRLVWKDMPSRGLNRDSITAAIAARCAGQQGGFWKFHDLIFANRGALNAAMYQTFAEQVGLDLEGFNRCLTGETSLPLVIRDQEEGVRLQIDATPYAFINARRLSGAPSYEMLRSMIEAELAALERDAAGQTQP